MGDGRMQSSHGGRKPGAAFPVHRSPWGWEKAPQSLTGCRDQVEVPPRSTHSKKFLFLHMKMLRCLLVLSPPLVPRSRAPGAKQLAFAAGSGTSSSFKTPSKWICSSLGLFKGPEGLDWLILILSLFFCRLIFSCSFPHTRLLPAALHEGTNTSPQTFHFAGILAALSNCMVVESGWLKPPYK